MTLPPSQSSNEAYNRDFADYYDRITGHKNYPREAEKLAAFIRQETPTGPPRILDVGCGTGKHAVLLAEMGFNVTAIDLSPDMVRMALAKATPVRFVSGDVGSLQERQFDFAYCLFNVVNCLETTEDLTTFLAKIHGRLDQGGAFLLECWNAVAVIVAPPEIVERTFEAPGEQIMRKVTPTADFLRQRLDLEYKVDVYDEGSAQPKKHFKVVHNLTLFTPNEMAYSLRQAGFRNIQMHTALPDLAEATIDDRMLAFSAQK